MTLVRSKRKFRQGLFLLLSFAALFWIMWLPLFQDSEGLRMNSLQYADAVFNELAKGSSWFIPQVREEVRQMPGETVSLSVKLARPELAQTALIELKGAGMAIVRESDDVISFSGNLAKLLEAAVNDAADLYNNDGAAVSGRHEGNAPLVVSAAWWQLLNPCIKELQKQGRLVAAEVVEQVVKKAIEPGNNFYGLPKAAVSENLVLICALLAFYVLYAIWYGFAIYQLFAGFGLLGAGEAGIDVEEAEI